MRKEVLFIIILTTLTFLSFSPLAVTKADTTGTIDTRVVMNTQPDDWLTPTKYTATIQTLNNGFTSLVDDNLTDNFVPTGNIIVKVALTTVLMKPGTTINAEGSVIENTFDLFGNPVITNSSSSSETIPLPQNNVWTDAFPLTCYYEKPELPFPESELSKVVLHFDINVYTEIAEIESDSPSEGLVITATYQGEHIGYSYVEHTILEQEPTATPTTEPTSNPTNQPATNPSQTSPNPTPTPSVPEFSTMCITALLITLIPIISIIKKKRTTFL